MSFPQRFTAAFAALLFVSASVSLAQNCAQATAEAYLDVSDVRARILNNGNLFWRGSPHVYNVPKGGPSNAIFASGIWIGGMVNGALHLAGSTYGPFEFWAGPHDSAASGEDCSIHDYMLDGKSYHSLESVVPDQTMTKWPAEYGAAFTDVNGDGLYRPQTGDRPVIYGDQTIVWLMNDVGNQHTRTDSPPLGIEVLGHAIATDNDTKDYLPQSTHYYYKVTNKSASNITDAYVGIFADVDLGNYQDDYVGSDSLLGLAYVYNSDNDDEGGEGYGAAPPAVGYQILFGPEARADGKDNDGDGVVDEDGERLGMSAFVFYNNGGGVQGDPGNGADMYNYMQGRWKDGQPITLGGNGLGFSNIPTPFMYSGNPPNFWSEFDSDGQGTAIAPADRRFLLSVGPFDLQSGETTDFYFSILTAFGSDNLDSVYKLKEYAADNRTWNTHPSELPTTNRSLNRPESAPQILSPGNGATNVPTSVSTQWAPAALAVEVELWENGRREQTLQSQITDTGNSLGWGPLDSLTTYSFRARFIGDLPGLWSPEWSFTTGTFSTAEFQSNPIVADFVVTSNASGPLDPPEGAAADWQGFPGTGVPTDRQQTTGQKWIIHAGGGTGDYQQFLSRWARNGMNRLGYTDWEIRFTGVGKALMFWGSGEVVDVPFELWNIGEDPSDPSDDKQYIPLLLDENGDGQWNLSATDHPVSGGTDDPYTDWIYWYEGDYQAEVANGFDFGTLGGEIFGRTVLVALDAGDVSDGTLDAIPAERRLPEIGTVFRIEMTPKPTPPLPITLAPANNQHVFGLNGTLFTWLAGSAMSQLVVATDSLLTDVVETALDPTPGITIMLPEGDYYWALTDPFLRQTEAVPFSVTYTDYVPPSSAQEFLLLLDVASGASEPLRLTVGLATNATDGFDEGRDQFAPPSPPSGVLDARSVIDGEAFLTDIRSVDTQAATWSIQLQSPDGNPLTLTWDSSGLPQDGAFDLVDLLGGVILDVDMRTVNSVTVPASLSQVQIIYRTNVSVDIAMSQGWNMVSLPVSPASAQVQDLFSAGIDNTLFRFDAIYHLVADGIMQPGTGYWLRNGDSQSVTVTGAPVQEVTIPLSKGWNMIGGPNCISPQDSWTDSGSILLSGTLFGFSGSYQLASQVEPGQGYWVRSAEAGSISLACVSGKRKRASAPAVAGDVIVISDELHQEARLYIGPMKDTREGAYTLPPAEAVPGMRASFAEGRYAAESAGEWIWIERATGSIEVKYDTEEPLRRVEVMDQDGNVSPLQAGEDGRFTLGIADVAIRVIDSSDSALPTVFALDGAYPNPFNPTTNIAFDLPQIADVQITVYDLLGRRVMQLTREGMPAGASRTMQVDGSRLASGQYFYRVEARMASGVEAATGKFTLLK